MLRRQWLQHVNMIGRRLMVRRRGLGVLRDRRNSNRLGGGTLREVLVSESRSVLRRNCARYGRSRARLVVLADDYRTHAPMGGDQLVTAWSCDLSTQSA
jgi:hypothetical protein